jgi:transcriptional antiterminator NusG
MTMQYRKGDIVGHVAIGSAAAELPLPRRWFIQRCTPGRDARVVARLRLFHVSAWSPSIVRYVDRLTGKPARRPHLGKRVERPFLPGLIFIPDFELDRVELRNGLVDDLFDLLRVGECLAALTPAHMTTLHRIVEGENEQVAPRNGRGRRNLKRGDKVYIADGPFRDFAAQVESLDSKGRLKAFVSALMGGVSVTLDETQVEPV